MKILRFPVSGFSLYRPTNEVNLGFISPVEILIFNPMLHVTCAIIEHNEKILICQRSERMKLPLKWEFPGGKIENGESKEDCLKREVQEELGLEIEVGSALTGVEHHYPEFSLCLYPFVCKWTGGSLAIAEHAQAIWVDKGTLSNYDWAEADVPVVEQYLQEKM